MTWQTSWKSPMKPANTFWHTNWTWDGSCWTMCHMYWLMTKSSSASICVVIVTNRFRMTQPSFQRSLQEIRHDFTATIRRQSSKPLSGKSPPPTHPNCARQFWMNVKRMLTRSSYVKSTQVATWPLRIEWLCETEVPMMINIHAKNVLFLWPLDF
jgi:hypothetical protein